MSEDQIDEILSKAIALWASPRDPKAFPSGLADLISQIGIFVPTDIAAALVGVVHRLQGSSHLLPETISDFAFRLHEPLLKLYGVDVRRHRDSLHTAVARLDSALAQMLSAVDAFIKTTGPMARTASGEVNKKARGLKVLPGEKAILSEVEILLGSTFRKFCESCENQDIAGITRIAFDLCQQAAAYSSPPYARSHSTLWRLVVEPIAKHVVQIVEQEASVTEAANTPSLKLAKTVFKLDLTKTDSEMTLACRLVNESGGRASKVSLEFDLSKLPIQIERIDPKGAFELEGDAELFVTFALIVHEPRHSAPVEMCYADRPSPCRRGYPNDRAAARAA